MATPGQPPGGNEQPSEASTQPRTTRMKTPNSGLERDGRGKPSPNGDSAVDQETLRAELARDLDTMANVSVPETPDK